MDYLQVGTSYLGYMPGSILYHNIKLVIDTSENYPGGHITFTVYNVYNYVIYEVVEKLFTITMHILDFERAYNDIESQFKDENFNIINIIYISGTEVPSRNEEERQKNTHSIFLHFKNNKLEKMQIGNDPTNDEITFHTSSSI